MIPSIFKVIHLLGAVMFLGNIGTGVFWKAHADRTRDPRVIAAVMDGIIASDRWFTVPGVFIILIGGFGTAGLLHYPLLHTGWILWSIGLFTFSGVAFMAQVVPLQRRMAKLARSAADGGTWRPDEYHALSRRWELWGGLALLAPLAIVVLMTLKPALPSL